MVVLIVFLPPLVLIAERRASKEALETGLGVEDLLSYPLPCLLSCLSTPVVLCKRSDTGLRHVF